MAKLQLFEYAVLYHPKATKDQVDNHTEPDSEVVVAPKRELFVSAKEAGIKAARAIPDDHAKHLDDLEVLVRPF